MPRLARNQAANGTSRGSAWGFVISDAASATAASSGRPLTTSRKATSAKST
jgi:hypothetical protein